MLTSLKSRVRASLRRYLGVTDPCSIRSTNRTNVVEYVGSVHTTSTRLGSFKVRYWIECDSPNPRPEDIKDEVSKCATVAVAYVAENPWIKRVALVIATEIAASLVRDAKYRSAAMCENCRIVVNAVEVVDLSTRTGVVYYPEWP